jgi:hypothetical protein
VRNMAASSGAVVAVSLREGHNAFACLTFSTILVLVSAVGQINYAFCCK